MTTVNEACSSRAGIDGSHDGGESVIADCGRRRSTCGYCKSQTRSSISHGLLTESLTVYDYQALIDRGWRRSGCYLYKHEMDKTCCPPYTIRLKASNFIPSKEQQRVSRKLERFLDGKLELQPKEQTENSGASSSSEVSNSGRKTIVTARSEEKNEAEPIMDELSKQIDQAVQRCIQNGEFPSNILVPKASVKKVFCAKRKKLAEGTEQILYTSNISFPIAAAIRRSQACEKGDRNNAEENRLSPEIVSEMLLTAMSKAWGIPDMFIKVCKGHINFLSASTDSFSYKDVPDNNILKEANSTSNGGSLCAKKGSENEQVRKQKLEIYLKRSVFDPEEHELYERYQLKVHKDKPEHISESSYRRFLVDSPLIEVAPSDDNKVPPCGFGSFHQQYRIDGRLIAVGVVDILPKCLSSVYLFWDPEYAFLSLGKYTALQEINWVKENQAHCPTLQDYYLGYYIHSCSKMRYKAAYHPSELLCPLRYQWVPFHVAKPLLDKKPYVILSDFMNSQNQCSLLPQASKTLVEPTTSEHDVDMEQGETNDQLLSYSDDDDDDDDDEMYESESEDSHIVSDSGNLTAKDYDIDNIRISFDGSQYRYKDIEQMLNPAGRKQLQSMLQSYRKVVGAELSERMVYEIR